MLRFYHRSGVFEGAALPSHHRARLVLAVQRYAQTGTSQRLPAATEQLCRNTAAESGALMTEPVPLAPGMAVGLDA